MKRISLVVGLVILVFAVAILAQTGAKPKGQTAEQELLKLEQEWTNADLKDDWTTMDRILADDYILTDRDGFVSAKAQCLAYMKSGEDKYLTLVMDDMKVRVYGDAAVVTGRATIKEMEKGKEISDVCRITNTWIKRPAAGSAWQLMPQG